MRKENLEKIIALRHELHMCPELSMDERNTARLIKEFLSRNTSFRIIDRGNWFYAVKEGKNSGNSGNNGINGNRGNSRKRIAFRADMDALPIPEDDTLSYYSRNPGVSHKCGHDGHCAALCGLALEVERMEAEGAEIGADICLLFQPGEETGSGAFLCRELIVEENISQIYAFHSLGGYPEGSVIYRAGLTQPASEGLKICFHGRTSHASYPEEGRNPAETVARVVLQAREFLQRKEFLQEKESPQTKDSYEDQPGGMALCTITGIRLGAGDFGISPGEADLCMTLRAEQESRMKQLEEQILKCAEEEGAKAGIQTSFSIHDYFPETRNDGQCLENVVRTASGLGLKLVPMEQLWRASEDFGWYLKDCPGAIFYIGSGEDYPPLHTSAFDFNDRILGTAVDMFAAIVMNCI